MSPRSRTIPLLVVALVAFTAVGCVGFANPEGWAPPVVQDNVVFVFGDDNSLRALDRDTGVPLWVFPNSLDPQQANIEIDAIYAEPIVSEDAVYIGTFESGLFALDPADGSLLWRVGDIDGHVIGTPAFDGERLYVATSEARLYILTPDGRPAAGTPAAGIRVSGPVWASVILFEEVVIIATMEGHLEAYAAEDGRHLAGWGFRASGAIPDIALLPGNLIFAPSFDRRVYLVDAESGEPLDPDGHRTRGWVWQQPATDGTAVYFGDLQGGVYALDLQSGREIWAIELRGTPKIKASPALVDGTLVIVDRGNSATFIDASTGAAQARIRVDLRGGTVRAPLRMDGDEIFFVTTRGHLWRLDPASRSAVEITGRDQA